MNDYAFTDSGSTEWTCWKLTQDKKCSAGACPCFLSPKKIVRRLKFITPALLLSSLRHRFAIAFSGSLSDSFSPASRVHFSRQANKSWKDVLVGSSLCDLDSLVRWRTNDLLPLDRKDTTPSLPRLLASNCSLSGENDCHETSRSLCRQHSTVDNQRVTRSLQTTVLPEMRTKQPATELGVVFLLAGKKHGLGTNLFFLSFFFYNCSVRNRTAVVTKHLGLLSIRKNHRSKTKQKTSQGLHGHSWIRIQYYMYACVPRGRWRSNHVATKMLPRLAPGQ